jgi:hypothetical protein
MPSLDMARGMMNQILVACVMLVACIDTTSSPGSHYQEEWHRKLAGFCVSLHLPNVSIPAARAATYRHVETSAFESSSGVRNGCMLLILLSKLAGRIM